MPARRAQDYGVGYYTGSSMTIDCTLDYLVWALRDEPASRPLIWLWGQRGRLLVADRKGLIVRLKATPPVRLLPAPGA